MKFYNKWICRLLIVCVLTVSLSGCSLPWNQQDKENLQRTEEDVKPSSAAETEELSTEENLGEEDEEALFMLPVRYDYREEGRCPGVGSQGELGTCWAFATMMALESSLLPEEVYDFSEDHISLHNSFGMGQDMGGDYTMAMAYLLAWQGPVLEEEDPYGDGESPEGLIPAKHVQEIRILDDRDFDAIKRSVYFHGGVQTSLYIALDEVENESQSHYYREDTCAYCYDGNQMPNHDIVIVGWDDTYPRENFSFDTGRDGAFLCMNSWGTAFGDDGLFYVSYADVNIGAHSLVYTGIEPADNYGRIYQTDLCGWLGQLGYGDEEAYFANVYTASGRERVEAAGFYAAGPDSEYQVYIIKNVGQAEELALGEPVASGRFKYAGYYTVKLNGPVDIDAGERFAVAVHIKTPGAVHPVAIEYQSDSSELMTQVDLTDGEGYISADGKRWSSTEREQSSNVCLKAYTGCGY